MLFVLCFVVLIGFLSWGRKGQNVVETFLKLRWFYRLMRWWDCWFWYFFENLLINLLHSLSININIWKRYWRGRRVWIKTRTSIKKLRFGNYSLFQLTIFNGGVLGGSNPNQKELYFLKWLFLFQDSVVQTVCNKICSATTQKYFKIKRFFY